MASNINNPVTIDIGGSTFTMDFEGQLRKALNHQADFPKELAYTSNMAKWAKIADGSYQTSDEISIIEATAKEVVSQMPSETNIIDLGAANSAKYEPYVREFLAQGKTCTYIPLDIENSSLAAQVGRARAKFPGLASYGIWGSFQHGDAYFKEIPPARLFLSLGSIFYNGPDEVAEERCENFRRHLNSSDRLIVGQDGPSALETTNAADPYNTKEYTAFFTGYLQAIQAEAGINVDVNEAWSFKSMTDKTKHYFSVTAKFDMVCFEYDDFVIEAGTTYQMFKSWKRSEAEIYQITEKKGLTAKLLGKAENSGMRQFLIKN
jgi:uncharacterized SAM-dependent methyltransferase